MPLQFPKRGVAVRVPLRVTLIRRLLQAIYFFRTLRVFERLTPTATRAGFVSGVIRNIGNSICRFTVVGATEEKLLSSVRVLCSPQHRLSVLSEPGCNY